ncbi:hypothetical protein [Aestuariivirga sp.]|uniref:hypothetical protein n=1 Tax=Aestuariivirga sp. TaxID=2650926 RepID=UPI0039E2F722
MAGTIWTKFFWADWESDASLRLCSLAAHGLWMKMLCIAAKADPTGYLTINGRSLGVTDIARLAGVTETECKSLLGELDRNGVFSRDRNGTIFSRRMVRDEKRSREAQKNGKKGGNPSLGKVTEKSSTLNPPLNPHLKPPDNGGDKTHKPIANSHKPEAAAPLPPNLHEQVSAALRQIPEVRKHPIFADDFVYPITQLIQQGYDLRSQIIPIVAKRAATAKFPIKGWSYFVSAIQEATGQNTPPPPVPEDETVWDNRLDVARRRRAWDVRWGPMPHAEGCRVPPQLLLDSDGVDWTAWRPGDALSA